jgi:hypothetical protein
MMELKTEQAARFTGTVFGNDVEVTIETEAPKEFWANAYTPGAS